MTNYRHHWMTPVDAATGPTCQPLRPDPALRGSVRRLLATLAVVALCAACSSVGTGDGSHSSVAGPASPGTTEGSTSPDATRSDVVRRYMTGVSTVSDDVLSLVEPGSAAGLESRCELASNRARGVSFFPYNDVPAGYQFAVGTVYSTFS